MNIRFERGKLIIGKNKPNMTEEEKSNSLNTLYIILCGIMFLFIIGKFVYDYNSQSNTVEIKQDSNICGDLNSCCQSIGYNNAINDWFYSCNFPVEHNIMGKCQKNEESKLTTINVNFKCNSMFGDYDCTICNGNNCQYWDANNSVCIDGVN